jgi:hypothetical protein
MKDGFQQVKDVIEQLQQCDPEAVVVMSSDEEGNSFGPLRDIGTNNVFYDHYVYVHHLTDELREHGYTEEDLSPYPDAPQAVVLWP